MENERNRHQEPCIVQEINYCVGESHGDDTMIYLETIVKDANDNSAHCEKKIGVMFGNARIIMEKATIANNDRVG